jgi:hypothetical protein
MRRNRVLAAVASVVMSTMHADVVRGQPSWTSRATDHFDIYYHRQQSDRVVDAVANDAELAYRRISFDLRHELSEKVQLILVQSNSDLPRDEQSAAEIVRANGSPDRHHLLLSLESIDDRRSVLLHELTHQFEFEMMAPWSDVPVWVSEGLADHQADAWSSSDVRDLRRALASGSIPAVGALEPSDRLWGHAVFDFVAAEYGTRGLQLYLMALRSSSFAAGDSGRVALGVAPDDFDWAFKIFVRARFMN